MGVEGLRGEETKEPVEWERVGRWESMLSEVEGVRRRENSCA